MSLYRHYKNKPYRYRGIVKHSETLEDLVLYETLYENELGKLWVRPKAMFHEDVTIDGKKRPRFEKADIKISTSENLTPESVERIGVLIKAIMGEWDPVWFGSTVRNHTKLFLATAELEGRLIGYKLGWEEDKWRFYSWLGGVLPEYRGLGIATSLMSAQHDWCRKQGYHKVSTKTQNRFREMLILNLKSGFQVIGTHESSDGGLKIVMEKDLLGSADSRKLG
ncbi:MAG: GNAT family N-acetyltransferase [Bdellovibrionia bacterium]